MRMRVARPGRGCRRLRGRALGRITTYHASPLWTLQRLCFEPDVAADPSDRGENRDPGTATEENKRLLTKEARLENGPRLRRVLRRFWHCGSGAVICPASRCSRMTVGRSGGSRRRSASWYQDDGRVHEAHRVRLGCLDEHDVPAPAIDKYVWKTLPQTSPETVQLISNGRRFGKASSIGASVRHSTTYPSRPAMLGSGHRPNGCTQRLLSISNYVHAKNPEIMDLYGGVPGRFHLDGMRGTPKDEENLQIIDHSSTRLPRR